MSKFKYLLAWSPTLLIAMVVLVISGCGSDSHYTVSGTATSGGTPLPDIVIWFSPTDRSQQDAHESFGVTDENGKFTMTYGAKGQGVVPGEHLVYVNDPDLYNETPRSAEYMTALKKYSEDSSTYTVTIDSDIEDMELKLD